MAALGSRTSIVALVAAALEPAAFGDLTTQGTMASLRELIEENVGANRQPEQFCFGLLEAFDIPQLWTLAGRNSAQP